jgi:DNA polymerase/3'-5' exonuclease PolX
VTIHALAYDLLEQLRPGCERIEIKGSLIRGKPDPKDIELLAIPIIQHVPNINDLFGGLEEQNLLDYYLDSVYAGREWDLDRVVKRNGPRYKRLRHVGFFTPPVPVCCDLFITTADQWGAQAVIRTGPADFSHMLVTRALRLGMKQEDGRLWRTHRDGTRTVLETPEEIDYFKALGMDYVAPELRGKVYA